MKTAYTLYPDWQEIWFVTDWNIGRFPAIELIIEQIAGVKSVEKGYWKQYKYHLFVAVENNRNLEVVARLIVQKIEEFFVD